ncbi:helix-turn-helix domain-containing protein [Acetobacterium wieringae]|uniref:winged helix-turn-helix transcriptional regulator n=1 Tax=Acetobacterium wieringae TaxID=52694 RepID=UPI0026EEB480|nr:winged helix-turn-helix transcriptional regulator [Acetobacterium wieringae]
MLENTSKLRTIDYALYEQVVNMIGGKWKMRIFYVLAMNHVLRYGEIKKLLIPITHKMLSTQLKEMEKDGLILRKEYPQIPPKVEYSLSQKAIDLRPMFESMCDWIHKYLK